jgi:branched-subunit amino acid ABC-type transport system permease component
MEMSHIRPLYRRGENSTITTFGSIQCAQNIIKKTAGSDGVIMPSRAGIAADTRSASAQFRWAVKIS